MQGKKIALVTGASKGIGAAIARDLAGDGFHIWINYRSDHEQAESVAGEIRHAGGDCTLLPFGCRRQSHSPGGARAVVGERGSGSIGKTMPASPGTVFWALMSPADWQDVLSVHLNGFFNVTRVVLARMMKKRRGRIINIVSTSGVNRNSRTG